MQAQLILGIDHFFADGNVAGQDLFCVHLVGEIQVVAVLGKIRRVKGGKKTGGTDRNQSSNKVPIQEPSAGVVNREESVVPVLNQGLRPWLEYIHMVIAANMATFELNQISLVIIIRQVNFIGFFYRSVQVQVFADKCQKRDFFQGFLQKLGSSKRDRFFFD